MNFLITLLGLATAVNAIKYHGHTPSISQYNTAAALSQMMLEESGVSIHSILRTDSADNDDVARFLAGAGFPNMTIADLRAQNTPLVVTDLQARDTVTTACSSQSKVSLSTTSAASFHVCTVLSGLAGGTVATLAYVLQGLSCSAADNGNPTFCNAVFIFTGTTGTAVSVAEVNQYCPLLFNSVNNGCNGKGGDASESGKEVIEGLSQKELSCNDETGDSCTQSSFQS